MAHDEELQEGSETAFQNLEGIIDHSDRRSRHPAVSELIQIQCHAQTALVRRSNRMVERKSRARLQPDLTCPKEISPHQGKSEKMLRSLNRIGILGHVGTGNLGDEAINLAVIH